MTAEVAVLNKLGVALAADSAMTFQVGQNQKIYNASNKLFSLSKFHPIGVMVYGNAEFMGIPWETIIKVYRRRIGSRSFARLEDYFTDFLDYLGSDTRLITDEEQRQTATMQIASYLLLIREELFEKVSETFSSAEDVDERSPITLLDGIVTEHVEQWESRPLTPGMDEAHELSLQSLYSAEIEAAIRGVFEKLPISDGSKKGLIRVSSMVLTRALLPESRSGVVIAGFGEDEHFPAIRAAELQSVVGGRLKYVESASINISADVGAAVVPFAQQDIVELFMHGVHPAYERLVFGWLKEILHALPTRILSADKRLKSAERGELSKRWKSIGEELLRDFHDRLQEHRDDTYVQPIMNVVSVLPKNEMAALAEALVNLTSLKRKISLEAETVGGPVDVAVISKGDGLVWIQRKHYFPGALNHQFFSNYFPTAADPRGSHDT